jgi:hypothetical protein
MIENVLSGPIICRALGLNENEGTVVVSKIIYFYIRQWFRRLISSGLNRIFTAMKYFFCLCLALASVYSPAQDTLYFINGRRLAGQVVQVTSTAVKFQQADSSMIIPRNQLSAVRYANGTRTSFNSGAVKPDAELLKISREHPEQLTAQGNNVFIKIIGDGRQEAEPVLTAALKEWGYWNVVQDESEAHFILSLKIEKLALAETTGIAIFKTRERREFKKSKTFWASSNAFTDYNGVRAVVEKIVDKYLKEEFH